MNNVQKQTYIHTYTKAANSCLNASKAPSLMGNFKNGD